MSLVSHYTLANDGLTVTLSVAAFGTDVFMADYLLSEDNTYSVSFVVAAGKTYIVSSSATNGTVTLDKWFETAF